MNKRRRFGAKRRRMQRQRDRWSRDMRIQLCVEQGIQSSATIRAHRMRDKRAA